MDNKTIQEALSELQKKAGKIAMNEAYFEGKNPYILSKPTEKKPDNRIPVPLAKSAVEKMSGYAGRKGDIKTVYSKIGASKDADSDLFLSYIRAMNTYNDEELETAELYEEMLIQGESFEIWWVSDEMELDSGLMTAEFKIVPTASVYLKYTDDIKKTLEHGIHFNGDNEKMTATVYEVGKQTEYESIGGGDFEVVPVLDPSTGEINESGEIITPFSQVPINVFSGNRRSTPLFEAQKHLIDQIDELMSKSSNEVDRFNAAIALFGNQVSPEFVDDLAKGMIRVIDDLDGQEDSSLPRYLHKDLSGIDSFYNTLMERTLEFYNDSIGMLNFSEKEFGNGIQSGIALKIKMYGMEVKAAQIETYFNRGLHNRLKLYADIFKASTKELDVNDYKVTVNSNRNLPVDDESKLRIAAMLMGLGLGLKEIIEYLPSSIIENKTEKEIEEMLDGDFEDEPEEPEVDTEEDE